MKLSALALAAALSLGSASSFALTSTLDLSTGSTGFANTPPAGTFTDIWNFTLTTASSFAGIVSSTVNGGQNIDFTAIALTGPSGPFNFTKVRSDPFETWTLSTPTLSAGSYALTLTGTDSAAIATYSGNVATAPVPEPGTYGLMLAGAGVVGFVALRRRKQA